MNNQTSRKGWIDLAKGIGIIFVVIQHWIGSEQLVFSNFICSFHMPLFFFVGGVLYKERPFEDTLLRKTQSLLIPFILFGLLEIIPQLFFHFLPPSTYVEKLSDVLSFRGGWFIKAMFLASIIFAAIETKTKKKSIMALTVFCLYVCGLICASCRVASVNSSIIQALVGCFFYYLGYLFSEYNLSKKIKDLSTKFKMLVLIGSIIVIILNLLVYNGFMVLMYDNEYGNSIIFTIKATSLSLSVLFICVIIGSFPAIEKLGRESFLIMIFHFPIYLLVRAATNQIEYDALPKVFLNTACIIAVITVSYVVAVITDKHFPVLSGHNPKKHRAS